MTEETISHEATGAVFISLRRRWDFLDDVIECGDEKGWVWFVQVADTTGSVNEDCSDEHAARALYRNLCNQNGIKVGYQPVVFAVEQELPADPVQAAVIVAQKWTDRLSATFPGSEKALAIGEEMMADPDFHRLAPTIIGNVSLADGWIPATLRTRARRVIAKDKANAEQSRLKMMDTIPGFGEF